MSVWEFKFSEHEEYLYFQTIMIHFEIRAKTMGFLHHNNDLEDYYHY